MPSSRLEGSSSLSTRHRCPSTVNFPLRQFGDWIACMRWPVTSQSHSTSPNNCVLGRLRQSQQACLLADYLFCTSNSSSMELCKFPKEFPSGAMSLETSRRCGSKNIHLLFARLSPVLSLILVAGYLGANHPATYSKAMHRRLCLTMFTGRCMQTFGVEPLSTHYA